MEPDFPDRARYGPSGRVDPVALVPAVLLLAAAALLVAGALCALLRFGALPIGITCLMPGFLLGFTTAFVVRRSHCRNRTFAVVLGAGFALVALGGFYHLDQYTRWGAPWERLDRLPGFIVFRMETDQLEFAHKWFAVRPAPPQAGVDPVRPLRVQPSWTWLGLVSDLLMLSIIPMVLGCKAASAPYSENVRRWLVNESLTLVPEEREPLRAALRDGTLAEWASREPRRIAPQSHCRVTVWYCPARGESAEAETYLAVDRLKPMRLTPTEAAQLTLLVPGLADLAGPALGALIAQAEQSNDPSAARVWPVPDLEAGRFMPPRVQLIRLLIYGLALTPGLGMLAMVGGVYAIFELFKPNQPPKGLLIGWAAGAGLVSLALLWWVCRSNFPRRAALGYLVKRVRAEIAARPDAIVRPDNPHAALVEMCPRRNFSAGRGDKSPVEYGLLVADFEQRAVLFEGDAHRYRFPAASIIGCSIELFSHEAMPTNTAPYHVVVRVRLGSGTWDFPYFPHAMIDGRNNWERAEALRIRIELVAQKFSAHEPPPPPPPPIHVVV